VVEQDAVAGVHSVGFAVVDGDPVGVDLGRAVGAARVEGGGFLLRNFPHLAKHFAGGRLVEAGLPLQAQDAEAFQNAQRTEGVGIGGVFGFFEGDGDVTLCGEVIDFVGLDLLQDADQAGGVGQVAMMEDEPAVGLVRVLVEVVDPLGVEQGGAAFNAVDDVALVQQELGEIRAVLAGDAGDECGFVHGSISLSVGFAFGLAGGPIFGHCIKFRHVLIRPIRFFLGARCRKLAAERFQKASAAKRSRAIGPSRPVNWQARTAATQPCRSLRKNCGSLDRFFQASAPIPPIRLFRSAR